MKKGDLVHFEYVSRHPSGVGWEFHKGIGVIVDYRPESDSYKIMTSDNKIIDRLDMHLQLVHKT